LENGGLALAHQLILLILLTTVGSSLFGAPVAAQSQAFNPLVVMIRSVQTGKCIQIDDSTYPAVGRLKTCNPNDSTLAFLFRRLSNNNVILEHHDTHLCLRADLSSSVGGYCFAFDPGLTLVSVSLGVFQLRQFFPPPVGLPYPPGYNCLKSLGASSVVPYDCKTGFQTAGRFTFVILKDRRR
jgi:hypothetical protein